MRDIIRIIDPDDSRIAMYRDIRERDLVGRHGRFIAEGKVVLRALLESSLFATESILVLENRLGGLAADLQHKSPETPLYVASGEVMDRIAGYPVHRGILAIGRRSPQKDIESVLPVQRRCLLVVCAGISNHDNIGSIFRNAAAFGADAVLLDKECCDPLYRKALRVSVGAALRVPFVKSGSVAEILDLLSAQKFDTFALSPAGNTPLEKTKPGARTAVVLGSEGSGLPQDILSATTPVRIAMTPGFDSLNVAAASAIALHHVSSMKA